MTNSSTITASEFNEVITEIVNSDTLLTTLVSLKARWSDEKEFEDFADYITAVKKCFVHKNIARFDSRIKVVSLTRHFHVVLQFAEKRITIKVKTKGKYQNLSACVVSKKAR